MGYTAGVAQSVEQRIRNAKVTSSIPVTGTRKARNQRGLGVRVRPFFVVDTLLQTQPPMSATNLPSTLEGLAMADLQRLLAQTDAAIAERRIEELKVLADGFARKLAVNGFSVKEGIGALKPYIGKNLRPASPPRQDPSA